ncbi:MAG: hypothetical protein QOE68_703, partial [Thermoanaerobaculia bacterium]|nr:hypothetical protein [Thermoanaerobaculia bacterium]
MLNEDRARPRFSTALLAAAFLFAAAPYAMAFLPWRFDTVIFEMPAVACFLGASVAVLVGAIASLRNVGLVPNWQWRAEFCASV